MNPAVSPSAGVDRAFLYIIGFSLALLLGITVVMIAFVFRYRRSRHPVPVDIRRHTGLELAWMVLPTLIALSMFYVGWDAYLGLRRVPEGALQIGVTGEMFLWTFTYPNGKESENLLVVPFGKPVKLNIASKDVIHSLSIPAFRVKIDAVPHLKTYVWFPADRIGTFSIFCTEYCGTGHSDMNADLKVVSPADYDRWLAQKEEEKPGASQAGEASEALKKIFDLKQFHAMEDKVSFYWRVDGPLLHVVLRAPVMGWIAIGLNPSRAMQGANFIVGYVKNGRAYVSDHYGTGLFKHEADDKVGGRSDITNVFGTESNGVTEIGFSIPLDSGDSKDVVLSTNTETTVLLASSSGADNFSAKHTYKKALKVNLGNGQSHPPK
jgi:cytochrome c oxidase subunit II